VSIVETKEDSINLVKELFSSQKLAVLSTQYGGQPFSNLIAFAYSDDLRLLIFVTNRDTHKYRNISAENKVSVLVDSRKHEISDFENAVAITAFGTAGEVKGSEWKTLATLYLEKYPDLKDFVNKPSNALIKMDITDLFIARFNSVYTIHLDD
jgi:nitroimidazol reductase NimA-like FMN-containing flavoprotein (pyridoxamine 5'-phosphate oxidase superfamily)